MNISLPQELREFVQTCVDSGEYKSASAVIRGALLLLLELKSERDKREVEHDAQLWQFQKEYLGSLPEIRTEDIESAQKRRKVRAEEPKTGT
jgi:putative addiction module CopG family antidote